MQFSRMVAQSGSYYRRLQVVCEPRQPEQDHASVDAVLPKDEVAEVLVRGDQQRPDVVGPLQHRVIIHSRIQLCDILYLVTVRSQA